MSELVFHPGLLLIAGAVILPWLRGSVRSAVVLLLPLAAIALVWSIPDGVVWQVRFLGLTLT
ncbi:MAG TPA: hypothetical protein VLN25_03115, partial [Burkholderiaceae bacterium]|nr:hypothetical protein [Burkholderiaceae bacterium]